MSANREKDFFKKLTKSIHTQRHAALAQQQARHTAADELLALKRRLVRLQGYEHLEPHGECILKRSGTRHSAARTLDARCAYRYVQDLVSPKGVLSVPVQQ